jgi:hypothetical protein
VRQKLDWLAICKSAASVSLFLLPLGILQDVLVHNKTIDKNSAVNLLIFGAILFLTAGAGFGAARLVDRDLAQHGAAAGLVAYAIVQGAGVVHHLIVAESLNPLSYIYLGLLSSTCGMLGGMLERRQRRLSALRDDVGHDPSRNGDHGAN